MAPMRVWVSLTENIEIPDGVSRNWGFVGNKCMPFFVVVSWRDFVIVGQLTVILVSYLGHSLSLSVIGRRIRDWLIYFDFFSNRCGKLVFFCYLTNLGVILPVHVPSLSEIGRMKEDGPLCFKVWFVETLRHDKISRVWFSDKLTNC